MKQKILFLIFIAIFGIAAKAQTIVGSGDGWSFDSEGLLTVTKDMSYSYTSYPWYSSRASVKSIEIGEGVTSIGNNAFYGYTNLTSVTIPEGVTSIGYYTFSGCSNLTSVTIPSTVTSIGSSTFEKCTNLINVTLNEHLTSIGSNAFSGCSNLTSVTIPSTVKEIYSSAFKDCKKINELHIGSVESWCKIKMTDYESCPLSAYASDKNVKLYVGDEEVTDLIIPEGVKNINDYAFRYCSGITSVTIPSTVESIGMDAFEKCKGIKELHIASIGSWCKIEFGNSVFINASKDVKLYVGDEEMTEVVIPEGIESIGNYAFHGCKYITSVTIPSTVTSIGGDAFYYCSGLTSITIPSSVISIGDYAFAYCPSMESISFLGGISNITLESNALYWYGDDGSYNYKYVFLYDNNVVNNLGSIFPSSIQRFFVPDEILETYRTTYENHYYFKDKFTGFSMIEKQGENDTEEQVVALSLEKGSYGFITWAVNSGEQVREGEEISIALTEDFDMDADNVTWQTLGTAEHPFKGIFEGNYLSVKGNHRANATQPKSIFGYIGEGAEIRNVVFSDFIIDATSAGVTDGGKTYYGLVARENKGLIRNSIFEGRMEIDADADDIENAEACLVIDNEEGGELDHVVGYFEGLDGEVTGNKTSIIVIQNIGHGRTRGHSKKTASNGKKKSKGNSTVSAEEPDDINLNYRLFTDEEFAGAEPAYWLNFDGEGYTGTFNGEWTQGTKHPVLAKGEHGATVGVKYNVVNRDESVLGPSPVFFATSKSSLEVEYSEKPLSIEVNGMEINASQIGDMKAKFSLASVNTDKGNVNVVLKYEKQSTPTAVDAIDAAGSQKTIKTVENGRVVIIRDGKKYDLAGRVLSDKF